MGRAARQAASLERQGGEASAAHTSHCALTAPALSGQGPAVHPQAQSRGTITCLEETRRKSAGIGQQHHGEYCRGTLLAFKGSPWCWHSHLHAGHYCAFGNQLGLTDPFIA